MTSLAETTRSLRARDRKALVAYFTAGYPDDASFDSLVRAAVDAGADIIEVGIPFSDPIADGPIIQKTSGEALARGMTLTRALETIARLSPQIEVPVVVMSYVNPILRFGVDAFAHAAAREDVESLVARVRAATDTPVYVGFGVSTPDTAATIASVSDGVIIGSRLMQLAGDGPASGSASRVADFLAGVRDKLDRLAGDVKSRS